jgi:hypothetical protein
VGGESGMNRKEKKNKGNEKALPTLLKEN